MSSITDVKISFGRMVVLYLKWTLAGLTAMFIVGLAFGGGWFFLIEVPADRQRASDEAEAAQLERRAMELRASEQARADLDRAQEREALRKASLATINEEIEKQEAILQQESDPVRQSMQTKLLEVLKAQQTKLENAPQTNP